MPERTNAASAVDLPPLVTFVLHKFSRGGSDRVAAYLARGFVEAGYRVELLVVVKGGEVERVLLDLLGAVPVHFIRKPSRWRPADLILGLRALIEHLRRVRPDVVISTANNTALISAVGCVLAGLRSTRLVLKTTNPIASSRHRGWIRSIRLWSYRWVFRHTAAVWTLSDEESAEMREEFPQFATLFSAVTQPYVTPAMERASALEFRRRDRTILSIARLTEQKRLDRLLRAFARTQTDNAHLLILGDGEERASLEQLAKELGISARVSMPGYLPDVAFALRKADLFVLTSDYEGLPAAVIEAMAANCPVITTDCFPSARSLVGQSEGCAIIEDLSPAAIAEHIDRALSRSRPTTLTTVASRYSIANGVASHLQSLHSVLQGEGGEAEGAGYRRLLRRARM